MGRTLIEAGHHDEQASIVAALEHAESGFIEHDAGELAGVGNLDVRIDESIDRFSNDFDVMIDFTLPVATLTHLDACVANGRRMVIGTTGFSAGEKQRIVDASREIAIVFAPNMSVGVNLCFKLLQTAAQVMGDEVDILGIKDPQKTTVTGVEMFRKLLDQGQAGDNVGCLLRGIDKDQVERGQVLAAPGSVNTHTKFECEVYILSKDEGGRHKPFFSNYTPQFYIRTLDVTGKIELPDDVKMVMPGDNVKMKVDLITPAAMEEKQRFAIREGGRTIGAGVISKIIE